jgi:hypothetical protein
VAAQATEHPERASTIHFQSSSWVCVGIRINYDLSLLNQLGFLVKPTAENQLLGIFIIGR